MKAAHRHPYGPHWRLHRAAWETLGDLRPFFARSYASFPLTCSSSMHIRSTNLFIRLQIMRVAAAILIVVLFIFVEVALPSASALDDPMKGPWCETEARSEEQARGPGNLAVFLVKVYRKYLSPIDGSHCPMHPSCSQYSIECLKKHGLFMGLLMTSDRLYRCGRDELASSPWILINGEAKCYDPVENNDFWLTHEK